MEPDDNNSEDDENIYTNIDKNFSNLDHSTQGIYLCAACRNIAYSIGGKIDDFDQNAAYIEYMELDGNEYEVTLCYHCVESGDWEDRARANLTADEEPRTSASIRHRLRSAITTSWATPDHPPSILAEQWLFARRLALVFAGVLITTLAVIVFTGLAVGLLDSPTAGVAWMIGATGWLGTAVSGFVTRPGLLIIGLGLAYLAHLKSVYAVVEPGPHTRTATRPRWHYLSLFSTVSVIGGLGWTFIEFGVLTTSALPIALFLWSGGALGLVYALHVTLLEDRGSYGLQYDPARWKFPVQYGLALTVLDGLVGLPWSPALARTIALLPPIVGLLYVGRRSLSFSTTTVGGLPSLPRLRRFLPSDPTTTSTTPEPAHASDDTESTETQTIAEYEADIDRLTDQLSRIRASSPNRPRTLRYTDLFRLKEDLDRALDADDSLGAGIEPIVRQFDELLAREGIEPITTTGLANPHEHKIVETVTVTDHTPGEIVEVYRPGFRLGDRVLQEAHVVVAADPAGRPP